MAGSRRRPGQDPKPKQGPSGPRRRRDRLMATLATASAPVDRVRAAAEYVRGALKTNPDAELAARIERALVAAGDDLYGFTREGRPAA